jgi:hypothetical protein
MLREGDHEGEDMGNLWTALTADDGWDLPELRHHWGTAFRVFGMPGTYTAVRRDNGEALTARDLDGLVAKIRRSYRAVPVPR